MPARHCRQSSMHLVNVLHAWVARYIRILRHHLPTVSQSSDVVYTAGRITRLPTSTRLKSESTRFDSSVVDRSSGRELNPLLQDFWREKSRGYTLNSMLNLYSPKNPVKTADNLAQELLDFIEHSTVLIKPVVAQIRYISRIKLTALAIIRQRATKLH